MKTNKIRLSHKRIVVLAMLMLVTGLFNLGQQSVWGQVQNQITFGQNGHVQFVDPDGQNAIYYSYSTEDANAQVKFTLYGLSGSEFATLYSSMNGQQEVPSVNGYTVATTWTEFIPQDNRKAYQTTALPTEVDSGIYLLVAENVSDVDDSPPVTRAAALLTVSPASMVLKADASGRFVVWASAIQTGAPVADMNVTLYDLEGNSLGNDTSDADGVAIIDIETPFNLNAWQGDKVIAVGQTGDVTTVTGADYIWRNANGYGWGGANAAYSAYLYTERPLYKPGDTVYFKAILRTSEEGTYAVAADETISFRLQDSRGDEVDTVELTTDEFGSAHGEFALSAGIPLGEYLLLATVGPDDGTQIFNASLKVEEYVKPEYSVLISGQNEDGAGDYGIAGQAMKIAVDAEYFFGQPTADADVTVRIYKSAYQWYRDWWRWGYYDWYPQPSNEFVGEFSGTTDADGRYVLEFTPESDSEYTTSYNIQATVTDAQGKPIDGSLTLPVHWNAAQMTMSTDKYGYQKGDPVVVNISLNNHNSTPIEGTEVTVNAYPDWYGYETTPRPPVVQTVTTDAEGKAQATFNNLTRGWYRLEATTTDSLGRALTRYTYAWIMSDDVSPWYYHTSEDLTVIVDKESYEIGDTAKLLIQSRLEDTMALVTFERNEVVEELIVKLEGPATTVSIPVTEKLAPNAIVKVHVYKPIAAEDVQLEEYYSRPTEAELVIARTEMIVPASHKRLSVEIEADAAEYLPGTQANLTIKVTDGDGSPVRAQVSLAMVDKALLALEADRSGDIFEAFYRRQGNNIGTFQGPPSPQEFYSPVDVELAPEADLADDVAVPTDADAGRDVSEDAIPLREEFLDTAIWLPDLVTDDNGQLVIPVDLPDNLTTWQSFVKAVTVETQVGQASDELLVTQELITRPSLPRFSVLGDTFQVGAVGQNYTGDTVTAEMSMSCSNLILLDDGTQLLDLANGGIDVTHWTAVASNIGMGTVTTTMQTGNGGDRVLLPLEVKPFAVPERSAFGGVLTDANSPYQHIFKVPANAVNEASVVRINLAPSIALSLLDDLSTLIDYPYGCVEQTMSRLMPAAAASKVYKELGIPNPKEAELPEIMEKGVTRLADLQYANGAWGWYGAGAVNEHMTGYVLLGLTMVQEAGFPVPQAVLDSGFAYLDSILPGLEDDDVRAYILYVQSRAGRGNLAAAQSLAGKAEKLDSYSVSVLAETLNREGDSDTATTILSEMLTRVIESATEAYLPSDAKNNWYHWKSMASDEKNTAAAISVLSEMDPTAEVLPKMVRWLLNQRRGSHYYSGAGWGDTQATAAAVNGLLKYIQVSKEFEANYSYAVLLNGITIVRGEVTPDNFSQPIEPIVIDGELLMTGENKLEILRTDNGAAAASSAAGGINGSGTLYINGSLRMQLFYSEFEEVTEASQGLKVRRNYYRYDPTAPNENRQPLGDEAVAMGDLIDVVVEVANDTEMAYVLVRSPIPAGFETVDDGIGTSPYSYGGLVADDFWHGWGYSYKDYRVDAVEFFVPQLWEGEHRYTYRLRAVTAGIFSAMPAEAGPMYDGNSDESLWGRSASEQFTIAPELLAPRPLLTGDFDNDCRVSAFDLRQVAAAWGTSDASTDLALSDGKVDLNDVVQLGGRIGANCLVDLPAPDGNGGTAKLAMTIPEEVEAGAPSFAVDIYIVEGTDVGSLAFSIGYDAAHAVVDGITWHGQFRNGVTFGPAIRSLDGQATGVQAADVEQITISGANESATFGVYSSSVTASSNTKVATVTFRELGTGETTVGLSQVQAASAGAKMMQTEITSSEEIIVLDGAEIFVPLIQ